MIDVNAVLNWFVAHGRHDLPWQKNPTPYRVWVSEIMLQQTQVNTVIPYYQRFMQRFPSIKTLANSAQDEVLAHWSGLGYYARARNLHRSAQQIMQQHSGRFPRHFEQIVNLPGIGRSTAGAIMSFGMQEPMPILDGNVKRVLCRTHGIHTWPGEPLTHQELWVLTERYTPKTRTNEYNQAMMDIGATLCTRSKPKCSACPLQNNCVAYHSGNFSQYPGKKPSKIRPIKQTYMLIMQNRSGEFLLQKRPPVGIWGGLWSFPEYDQNCDWKQYCRNNFGILVDSIKTLDTISHQFSHFQLDIFPLCLTVRANSNQIMESSEQVWYNLDHTLPGGIAAPVSNLLQQLRKEACT